MLRRSRLCVRALLRLLAVLTLVLLLLVAHSVDAGGIRIVVVQIDIPEKEPEQRRLAALIANDVLPQKLEQGFSQRYGISPLIDLVPRSKVGDVRKFAISVLGVLDVLIVPEVKFLGDDFIYELKVWDLRKGWDPDKKERTVVAAPDLRTGARFAAVEKSLRTASERIAAALIETPLDSWGDRLTPPLVGLVSVWCIVPGSAQPQLQDLLAAELTVSLPFSLSKEAHSRQLRLDFVGLGHRDYYEECRGRLSSSGDVSQPRGAERKGEYTTWTLSGQLSIVGPELWLRLFAEHRKIGQTFVLQPVKIQQWQPGDDRLSEEIAKDIINALVQAVERKQ